MDMPQGRSSTRGNLLDRQQFLPVQKISWKPLGLQLQFVPEGRSACGQQNHWAWNHRNPPSGSFQRSAFQCIDDSGRKIISFNKVLTDSEAMLNCLALKRQRRGYKSVCVSIGWRINSADRCVHVFMNILFTHTVVSSTCNPVNDSYHLILNLLPMTSREFIFKENTEIKYEEKKQKHRADRLFKTGTTVTSFSNNS